MRIPVKQHVVTIYFPADNHQKLRKVHINHANFPSIRCVWLWFLAHRVRTVFFRENKYVNKKHFTKPPTNLFWVSSWCVAGDNRSSDVCKLGFAFKAYIRIIGVAEPYLVQRKVNWNGCSYKSSAAHHKFTWWSRMVVW